MREMLRFYIDGQWVDPATPNPVDVDHAVAAAKRAFETYAGTTRDERLQLLGNILEVYATRHDDIATAIMEEMGAPWKLASGAQAWSGPQHLKATIRALKDLSFEEHNRSTLIVREPTGVPAGVFNLVNGDGPTVGTRLAEHPDVAMVSFTGSTRAGVAVATHAAPTVKRVAQELGGKSANIIVDDTNFEQAVRSGTQACFDNTGQSCDAPTRMLVPGNRMHDAARIAAEIADAVRVGDPRDDTTGMGPLVSERQWNKVQTLIRQGIDEGATLVAGGPGKPEGLDVGYFVKPTVFADVSNDMHIAREEIFGPVLSILPYEDDDDAVRIANDSPYGLSGYVSSADLDRARRIAARLETGMVHVNGAELDSMAPFGGYKQSGNGREWGREGIGEFLETKSIYGYDPAP